MFPRTPVGNLPTFCLDPSKTAYLESHKTPLCPELTNEWKAEGAQCHTQFVGKRHADMKFSGYKEGDMVIPDWRLMEQTDMQWIMVNKNIYNVTQYVDGLRHNRTNVIEEEPSHPNAYLMEALHLMVVHKLNQDATQVYNDLFKGSGDYQLYVLILLFDV
jgi:hypothetical protein